MLKMWTSILKMTPSTVKADYGGTLRTGLGFCWTKNILTRWALKTSYNWGEITPISRGEITPVTHLFSAIYRGEITPFINGRGPPCKIPQQ